MRFELKHPSAVFTLTALGDEFSILPEHVLGKVPHERLRTSDFGEHPVGSGPFKLARWQHDVDATFVPNPYAWRKPHMSRFDVRTIFNDQSEIEAIANGSADLIDDMSSTQYRQLQRIAPDVVIMTFGSIYLDVTQPNLRRPGLDDVIVRRAMMYGQDNAAVIHGMMFDQVDVLDGLVPKALKHWYNPNVTKYRYDPGQGACAARRRRLARWGRRRAPQRQDAPIVPAAAQSRLVNIHGHDARFCC